MSENIINISIGNDLDDVFIKFIKIDQITSQKTVATFQITNNNPDYDFYKKMIGIYKTEGNK